MLLLAFELALAIYASINQTKVSEDGEWEMLESLFAEALLSFALAHHVAIFLFCRIHLNSL